ncbi:C-C chemokine receptor type 6a [Astyanax mexicanus]|uniref:Chemokine (C-C motif) receptor 6a n=1 Tax=Astyanax mexicanus TaxID=7994 RepID=A0A3B1INI7_ASTMX|nr:C-C chemokine receptor type 6a [Astyanax mexicanus]
MRHRATVTQQRTLNRSTADLWQKRVKMNDSYDDIYNNLEEPCDAQVSPTVQHVLQVYVYSIICILGFIGNTLVILTYAFYKRTKSMTDVYLLNVAIADILFVVALPLIIFSEQNQWALGTWSCKLLRGIYSINLYSGILLLACISLDRYLAIVQARRSFWLRSRTLVYSYLICAVVWLKAFLLSLPTFIFYEHYEVGELGTEYSYYNDEVTDNSTTDGEEDKSHYVCYFRFTNNDTAQHMKRLVPSAQMAVGFFLPLLIMGFCYSQVLFVLLRARNFQRHKAVRVVMTVVLVFIACHLPYNMVLLYDTITIFFQKECSEERTIKLVLFLTESLAFLHCCLNPLLYAFVGVNFRNHFCKIVEDVWCLGKRYIGARRSSRANSDGYYSSRRSVEGENATSFTM